MEQGYIRIPGSRPIKRNPRHIIQNREQQWDSRFILGKISDYSPQQNKYRSVKKKNVLMGPGRIRKVRDSPAPMGAVTSSKGIDESQSSLRNLHYRLQALWEAKQIDPEIQAAFVCALEILSADQKQKLIFHEIEDLENNQSIGQAVQLREEVLRYLKKASSAEDIDRSSVIENLTALRVHSIHIVEIVQVWREKFHQINPAKTFVYKLKNINYLDKMCEDALFLKDTPLATLFQFSNSPDPFLLAISHPRPGTIDIPIPPSLLKRAQVCESLLFNKTSSQQEQEINKDEKKYAISEPHDLLRELEEYKVPSVLTETLGSPSEAYDSRFELHNPAVLWVTHNGERVGLLVLNLEVQKTLQKRLHISHISSTSTEIFPAVLKLCLEYIWTNYPCVEIRIGLISHKNAQEKFETNKEVKGHFDNVGFRWKQLLHSKAYANPLQLLGLRRPEDKECTNNNTMKLFDDSISLAYACVAQLDMVNDPSEYSASDLDPISVIGLVCALKSTGYNISDLKPERIAELIRQFEPGWVPPAFRYRKDSGTQDALKDPYTLGLDLSLAQKSLETAVSCAAIGISWNKSFNGDINGKPYTKICDTEISVMASGSQTVYIVPTEDQQFSFFFIPYDKKPSDTFELAKEILKNMSAVVDVKNEIWIPELKESSFRNLRGVTGQSVEEFTISHCFETYSISLGNGRHPNGSLLVTPSSQEIILEGPFIYGLIHSKLDEDLEIPYLVLYNN